MTMNKADGSGSRVYLDADMEPYINGTKKAADWNSLVFSDWSPQTQHDVSISGGGDKYQYYVSMGYLFQEGFFRSRDLNYSKYNLRSNINAEMLNYDGLDLEQNTVAMMTADISGYKKYRQKQFQTSASLEYDFGTLSDVLQGLTLKGLASYDYRFDDNEMFRKSYSLYAKNSLTGEYVSKEFADHSDRLTREHYSKQQVLGQILLNYNRKFTDRHSVGATFGAEAQRRKGDNYYIYGDLAFSTPYFTALKDNTESTFVGINTGLDAFHDIEYRALIGRVNYSFDDRYLFEGQFRYDGSSKFAPGHQWGFFPLGRLESLPGTLVQEYLLPVIHQPVQDPRQLRLARRRQRNQLRMGVRLHLSGHIRRRREGILQQLRPWLPDRWIIHLRCGHIPAS